MSRYSVDQNTKEATSTQAPAGITGGWKLVSISYGNAKDDGTSLYNGLKIIWKNKTGQQLKHMVFDVNEKMVADNAEKYPKKARIDIKDTKGNVIVKKEETITPEAAIEQAYTEQARFFKHLMTKYLPEEEAIVNASSFEDLCNQTVAKINAVLDKQETVRLVITLNKKNFPQLRSYMPNIERESVNPSLLKLGMNDKVVATQPDEKPQEMPAENAMPEDELPWQ